MRVRFSRALLLVAALVLGCSRATIRQPTLEVDALLFGNASIDVCQYTPTTEPVCPTPSSCITLTTTTTSTAEGIFAGLFGVVSGLIAGGMLGA